MTRWHVLRMQIMLNIMLIDKNSLCLLTKRARARSTVVFIVLGSPVVSIVFGILWEPGSWVPLSLGTGFLSWEPLGTGFLSWEPGSWFWEPGSWVGNQVPELGTGFLSWEPGSWLSRILKVLTLISMTEVFSDTMCTCSVCKSCSTSCSSTKIVFVY